MTDGSCNSWKTDIEAMEGWIQNASWCTCTSHATAFNGNPHGHFVGCPSHGTEKPHRLDVEAALLAEAKRLRRLVPEARKVEGAIDVVDDIRKRDQVVQLNVAHAKRTQEERDRSVLLGVVDDLLADGATFAGLPDYVVHGAADFGATALGLSAWTADREKRARETYDAAVERGGSSEAFVGKIDDALRESERVARQENGALRYQLWLAQQETEAYKARAQNAWRIGDACEVRMGGTQWIPGRIVDIGNNPVVGEWVSVHVPSKGKTVPRSMSGDSDCFRRPEEG